ncbi:MAG TPA: tyrosine-type recombinase/integrase [Thermoanaerobaculia bacterium]|nr:tyrosine-type recombinase/integrase [Thermoanaerobaculia bacterium]
MTLPTIDEGLRAAIGGRGAISYLTKDEVEQVFRTISPDNTRDQLMFDLIYRHGLRRREATLLRLEDVLPEDRIWIPRLKGAVPGTYSLHPVTRKLLRRYLQEERRFDGCRFLLRGLRHRPNPLSVALIYQLFRHYATRAGISEDRRHVHVLRHSVAVHMMNAGFDAADVQDWLGHRSITSTLVYARITNKRRDQNYERMVRSNDFAVTAPE